MATCCSRLIVKLKMVKIQWFLFSEPLNHVITIRGQILVSRTDDETLTLTVVCPFKTLSVCI